MDTKKLLKCKASVSKSHVEYAFLDKGFDVLIEHGQVKGIDEKARVCVQMMQHILANMDHLLLNPANDFLFVATTNKIEEFVSNPLATPHLRGICLDILTNLSKHTFQKDANDKVDATKLNEKVKDLTTKYMSTPELITETILHGQPKVQCPLPLPIPSRTTRSGRKY